MVGPDDTLNTQSETLHTTCRHFAMCFTSA